MLPYSGPDARQYENDAVSKAYRELAQFTDEAFLATDKAELVDLITEKVSVVPLNITGDPEHINVRERGADYISIEIPVVYHVNHREAIRMGLSSEHSDEAEIRQQMQYRVDDSRVVVPCMRNTNAVVVRTQKTLSLLDRLNRELTNVAASVHGRVSILVEQRSAQIAEARRKEEEFQQGLQQHGIVLKERADATKPVQIAVKRTIEDLRQQASKPADQLEPTISRETRDAIIQLIDNAGKGTEVAPSVYQRLGEEDLRTIILGYLNAVFERPAAQGEVFSKLGKADIHLVVDGSNVLIGECKNWTGSAEYPADVQQLFRYMNIRQTIGVMVVFSQTASFDRTVQSAWNAVGTMISLNRDITRRSDSSFVSEHVHPDDPDRSIQVIHLFFNLHTEGKSRRGRRTANHASVDNDTN